MEFQNTFKIYRLYAANENGNIRDTYTGKKCYEELSNT